MKKIIYVILGGLFLLQMLFLPVLGGGGIQEIVISEYAPIWYSVIGVIGCMYLSGNAAKGAAVRLQKIYTICIAAITLCSLIASMSVDFIKRMQLDNAIGIKAVLLVFILYEAVVLVGVIYDFHNIKQENNIWILASIKIICCECAVAMMKKLGFAAESELYQAKWYIGWLPVIVGVISIIVVYYWKKWCGKQQEIRERTQRELMFQMEKYYNQLAKSDSDLKRFRHDYKNHLKSISYLAQQGKSDEIVSYLEDVQEISTSTYIGIDVGDEFISAILSDFSQIANKHDIAYTVQGHISKQLYIKRVDLCCVFSNALKNALAAAENMLEGERKVEVILAEYQEMLVITVKNSVEKMPVIEHQQIRFNKEKDSGHGLGIQNMRSVINKYQGSMSYESKKEHELELHIFLPYK